MKLRDYMLNESIQDKGIFKACFMAASPAAGKSYVIKKISVQIQPRVVNSDTWTEFLKAFDLEKWKDQYGYKIRHLTEEQLILYLNSMLPLWIDSTSSAPSNVFRRNGILESMGYDTGMIWINCDIETAKRRAKDREKEIGRSVSEEYIEAVYKKIQPLKGFYKSKFKFFVEIDNNDGELTDEVVISAYKKAQNFFSEPVVNPIGKQNIEKLSSSGGKYLYDLDDYSKENIKKMVNIWFK